MQSDLKQQESKRAALFGQSGTDGLDEEFAKSIGNMNDTINDAEEMVYKQDKLFGDMDSLLMMQQVCTKSLLLMLHCLESYILHFFQQTTICAMTFCKFNFFLFLN